MYELALEYRENRDFNVGSRLWQFTVTSSELCNAQAKFDRNGFE